MIPRDLNCMLDEIQKTALLDLHVAAPGQIQAYDATTQTADIVLGHKHQVPDDFGAFQTEDPPVLNDVPVVFPRSANMFLTFPLAAGDTVLVVFCDRSTDQWRAKGEQCSPSDPEVMGMSGAVAIPGLYPDARLLTGVSTSDAVLGAQNGVQIHVKAGGTVEITSAGASSALDYVAMANLVISSVSAMLQAGAVAGGPGAANFTAAKTFWDGVPGVAPGAVVASTNLKAD